MGKGCPQQDRCALLGLLCLNSLCGPGWSQTHGSCPSLRGMKLTLHIQNPLSLHGRVSRCNPATVALGCGLPGPLQKEVAATCAPEIFFEVESCLFAQAGLELHSPSSCPSHCTGVTGVASPMCHRSVLQNGQMESEHLCLLLLPELLASQLAQHILALRSSSATAQEQTWPSAAKAAWPGVELPTAL